MRHETLPKQLRLDPATCTAPNPSEVEDFVMRRQSLELKEVGQMPTKTGGRVVFFWFFRKVLKLCHFGPMVFFQCLRVFFPISTWHQANQPGDIEDRGENKGEACFFSHGV